MAVKLAVDKVGAAPKEQANGTTMQEASPMLRMLAPCARYFLPNQMSVRIVNTTPPWADMPPCQTLSTPQYGNSEEKPSRVG